MSCFTEATISGRRIGSLWVAKGHEPQRLGSAEAREEGRGTCLIVRSAQMGQGGVGLLKRLTLLKARVHLDRIRNASTARRVDRMI